MNVRINPSILAADFLNLERDLKTVENADFIHVDIMDNHFVPNLTFGQQMVTKLVEVSKIPLDLHLMITDVDKWGLVFAKLGPHSVTFHLEATENPVSLARGIRELGVRAGIAIKPNTTTEFVIENLSEFDQVLVMTVEPGFGGQEFMRDMMFKVEQIRAAASSKKIEVWLQVDGGIDRKTIEIAARSGADTFVAGSSVFKAADRGGEIEILRAAALASAHDHH